MMIHKRRSGKTYAGILYAADVIRRGGTVIYPHTNEVWFKEFVEGIEGQGVKCDYLKTYATPPLKQVFDSEGDLVKVIPQEKKHTGYLIKPLSL
jgi:hypothetical protein